MWQDEILDEIHKMRAEHAKSFNLVALQWTLNLEIGGLGNEFYG